MNRNPMKAVKAFFSWSPEPTNSVWTVESQEFVTNPVSRLALRGVEVMRLQYGCLTVSIPMSPDADTQKDMNALFKVLYQAGVVRELQVISRKVDGTFVGSVGSSLKNPINTYAVSFGEPECRVGRYRSFHCRHEGRKFSVRLHDFLHCEDVVRDALLGQIARSPHVKCKNPDGVALAEDTLYLG